MTASPSHPPSTSLQQLIEASLARRFPPHVADASDVVGLTISSLRQVERGSGAVVMLCVDLTESVLQEAINLKADQIICYSPVPSRPLARLSMDEIDGRIALHCASHAIAVHSLHSACAHAARGMLDWLGGSLAAGQLSPIVPHNEVEGAGRGRLLHTERALPLSELVLKLKELLSVKHLRLALGVSVDEASLPKAQECCFVQSVAIEAGKASVLHQTPANVYIASEMAHMEVLAANARGVVVILTGQSTIERAYLRSLEKELHAEYSRSDWNVKVKCSMVDCSPFAIV